MFVSENCCGLLLTGKLSFPFFLSSCASVIDVSVISKDRDFSAFVLNYSDLFSALQSEACGTAEVPGQSLLSKDTGTRFLVCFLVCLGAYNFVGKAELSVDFRA